MKKLSKKLWIILGSGVLGVIAVVTVLFLNIKTTVPNVCNATFDDASRTLKNSHLRYEIKKEYSETVPENIVIRQDIASNEKLKIGSTVTITVSKGEKPVEVPSVKFKDISEAKTTLENLKLIVSVIEKFNDNYEKGTVIYQNISAGREVKKGTEIKLVVSKGQDLVLVPNVVGKNSETATSELIAAGLDIITDFKCSNTVAEGTILSQDIKAGDMIKRNSKVTVYVSAGVANTVGNTPDNSVVWGLVASQGNWVYFNNSSHDGYLYKMRQDGSQKQLISRDCCLGINVVGEWIYYYKEDSYDGNYGLYKIRLDGSQRTKLNSIKYQYFVHVVGDYIYTSNSHGDGYLYRTKTDGTERTAICKEKCGGVVILGDWIYYYASDGSLYKIRTDGLNKTLIRRGPAGGEFVTDGQKMVVIDGDRHFYLNADGTQISTFSIYNVQRDFLNMNDGWVYYLEHDFRTNIENGGLSSFCKMRYDGSQRTKILDLTFENHANFYICVLDGWLYFPNDDDGDHMYRIRTDGTNLEKV